MKNKIWFGLGFGLVVLTLGFLVGGSHSPVAGVAITAVFGLAAPVLGVASSKPDSQQATTPQSRFSFGPDELGILGKILTLFFVFFASGLALGAAARLNNWPQSHPEAQVFPWKEKKPATAYRAVDWAIAKYRLHNIGYSEAQIEELYALDSNQGSQNLGQPPLSLLFSHGDIGGELPSGIFVYQEPSSASSFNKDTAENRTLHDEILGASAGGK